MGLICLLWSSPRFLWSKVIICRPFDGCQTAANRPQHRFLYFTLADLCPMGLICLLWSSLLFLWFQNIVCRPLNVCQTAANRLQHALLLVTIAELCPFGLICLRWSPPFPLWSNVIYGDLSMHVILLQIVLSTPSCILPQQTCAPWGLYVFYRALFSYYGSKTMCLDSLMCDQLLQIVFSMPPCFLPWGSFVFYGAPLNPVVKSHYMSTI